jgi:hypothetical protein
MIPDPKLSDPRLSDSKLPFAGAPVSVAELKLPAGVSVSSRSPSFARLWLRRIGVLFFVFLCATLGVMLMILPWRPEWSDNPLLFATPTLRTVIASGFVRGLATGLGALNVWIGFSEAIQYREED